MLSSGNSSLADRVLIRLFGLVVARGPQKLTTYALIQLAPLPDDAVKWERERGPRTDGDAAEGVFLRTEAMDLPTGIPEWRPMPMSGRLGDRRAGGSRGIALRKAELSYFSGLP